MKTGRLTRDSFIESYKVSPRELSKLIKDINRIEYVRDLLIKPCLHRGDLELTVFNFLDKALDERRQRLNSTFTDTLKGRR